MNVERVNSKKNKVTIVGFTLVCLLLNIDNLQALFHFRIPHYISTYSVYFPFLFVLLIFFQKTSNTIKVSQEKMWEAKKGAVLHLNNTKLILRYGTFSCIVVLFLFPNIYGHQSGFSSFNISILIGLIIAIAITLIYGSLKKGFHVGYCNEGVLYGYTSKVMLITWDDLSDFEISENHQIVTIYCKRKLSIDKITLQNKSDFEHLKKLIIHQLEYKNVAKLLTDDT